MSDFLKRTRKAWNTLLGKDQLLPEDIISVGYSERPDRRRFSHGNDRSLVTPLYTRMGIDAATYRFAHVRVNKNRAFQEEIPSGLNSCLSVEANIDQPAASFVQDAIMSLCDEGVIAIVPVDTTTNPNDGTFDILSMRVGKIIQWFPSSVKVRLYNDRTGNHEEKILQKTTVAVVENPFSAVMNEPSSTLRRLIEKMVLLDAIDRKTGGKLDLIIQLPFVVRNPLKQEQAEKRRKDIQEQLENSQYGIAYTDATEHITQLNRPVENTLLSEVEYLTKMLYSQLGMSEAVVNGTADDKELQNYFTRTVDPLVSALTSAMSRTFLSKTARTQGQEVMAFRAAFRYIPTSMLPDIADKLTRNEILSSNEIRGLLGYYPSDDPSADELRNKNLNKQEQIPENQNGRGSYDEEETQQ